MNDNNKNVLITEQNVFPETVKIGRSYYVIERHFTSDRPITDAIYELLRVEDSLNDSDIVKNSA